MNEPSGFHSIFPGFPRQVWQIPPYNSQAPCTVSSTLSFFSFLPVRLEGQGILLSVSHLGERRNWQEGSTLTRVKVRTRWGHKSMTQSAGSRIMSSQCNAHSLTPTAQFPLQKGAGQTCLSGLRQSQGENALESTFNWKSAVHLFNQHYLSTYRVRMY